VYRPSS